MNEEVKMIPLGEIYIVNPRHRDQKKFEVIIQSIKNVGLKVPIQVRRRPANEQDVYKYDLICGRAARSLHGAGVQGNSGRTCGNYQKRNC